jgi:hypothetical protein
MLIDRFNELLPWYVNGTLDAADRTWMDKYLQDHPRARQQLRWEQLIHEDVRRDSINVSEEIGLDKAMARIHSEASASAIVEEESKSHTDLETHWQTRPSMLKQQGLLSPDGKTAQKDQSLSLTKNRMEKSRFQHDAIRLEPEYRHLVVNFAKLVVARLSPHELPLFSYISENFIKNPRVAFSFTKKNQALAFGATTEEMAITTPVLAVTAELLAYLINELKTLSAEAKIATLSTIFKVPSAQKFQAHYSLSSIQLTQIADLIESAATRTGLSSPRITSLVELIEKILASE